MCGSILDGLVGGIQRKCFHLEMIQAQQTRSHQVHLPSPMMGGDELPEDYHKPQGFRVKLSPTDPAEAEHLFGALAENGTVCAPLAPTFWAERFGMLDDQFGVPWMINCEKCP